MRRLGMLGLICAVVLAGLTSCSVATEGAVGVRLDADGRLVGMFDWCRGKAGTDAITLYLGYVATFRTPQDFVRYADTVCDN
ncbi:hypothetical protein ABGB07_41425 [Micromonosporaceae bacterium B7E4]